MIKSPATYKSSENIAADTSELKKDSTVFKRLIGFIILLSALCLLLLPQDAFAWPEKRDHCRVCHTLNDPDATISVFLDGVATSSINMPNDGTGSFEVDYIFTNVTDAGSGYGIGAHIVVPLNWQVAPGTGTYSPPGWNSVWDVADGGSWVGPFGDPSPFIEAPDGFSLNFDNSSWDTGNRDSGCDNGGSCNPGIDLDGSADSIGTDAIITIPNGTPAGIYNMRVMGIGHDSISGQRAYIENIITVTVSSDVTSVVSEISPNNVVAGSAGNAFTYDILPTIQGTATGVDWVEITTPAGYSNLTVTGVSVGGSGLTANCPTPGSGQYCATIAAPLMTIVLGDLVSISLTNIQVSFAADAPGSLGYDSFTASVDNTVTPIGAEPTTEGNADGDPIDLNSQYVTVSGSALTWVGDGADNDFNTPANWNPAQIPTSSHSCTINSTNNRQPNILTNAFCGSLTLGTGGTVMTLTFTSQNLNIAGDVTVGGNGRISPSGTPTSVFTIGGNWTDDIGTTNFTSSNLHLQYTFTGTDKLISTDEEFYDVLLQGTISLNTDISIANSLNIAGGGSLYQGANTIIMNGPSFSNGGTYIHTCNSILEINSTLNLSNGEHYPDVIVNSGADVTGGNPVYIDCDLTLQSGALFTTGSDLHIEGDWINNGATIDMGSGEVHIRGLNSKIRGTTSTTFYDLRIGDVLGRQVTAELEPTINNNLIVSAGDIFTILQNLNITVGGNTTISGTLNMSGTSTFYSATGSNTGITVDNNGLLFAQGTDDANRVTFTRIGGAGGSNYWELVINGGVDLDFVDIYYTQAAAAANGFAINTPNGQTLDLDNVSINDVEDTNGTHMMYYGSPQSITATGIDFYQGTLTAANDFNVDADGGGSTVTFVGYGGDFGGEDKDEDNSGTATWIAASTTIGDGTSPSNKTVALNSTNHAVNAFTLSTNSGTDTLTALTITRSGTGVDADVASGGVKLWRDDGSSDDEWDSSDTQIGSGVSFSGGTASFGSLSESINTTPTQYLITYDVSSTATTGNTLLGAVTAASVTNTLVNNDSSDATLTIDSVCNVTTETDGIAGSLRNCIIWANGNPGTDTIVVPAGNYNLTIDGIGEDASGTGDLDIDSNLTIDGAGASTTTIDAIGLSPRDRVFHMISGDIYINDVTIKNGDAGGNEGGGMYAPSGGASGLTLTDVIITSNNANHGGGIRTSVTTILNDVEVSGNTASFFGGGIRSDISLTWNGGTASGNNGANGGGIANIAPSGVVNLTNVTLSGNTATTSGGGFYNERTATLTNVTIYGNNAPTGAGIRRTGGAAIPTVRNSIIANNTGGNCNNSMSTGGGNLESTTNTCSFTDPSDQVNVTAGQLNIDATLKNNGGPTQTHALLSGSFAIDEAINANCPAADQRGTARGIDGDATPDSPEVGDCDIGAYEYDPAAATTTVGDGTAPANTTTPVNSTNNAVSSFTLVTDSGSDTLTALTVTRTGGADADVASNGVKIWDDSTGSTPNEWDSGDTQIGTGQSLSSGTASFSSLSENITTTAKQYLITYDIASNATTGNALQGAVTSATVSNSLTNNDTNDATLTVGGCQVVNTNNSGAGSLDECINYANSNPGTTISFNIPTSDGGYQPDPGDGNRWWRIQPNGSALPDITADGTIIDATTQTTNQGNTNLIGPEVELDGSLAGDNYGFVILDSANTQIRGFIINSFAPGNSKAGIVITQTNAAGNVVAGNYIGTNYSGSVADANDSGVAVIIGANGNTIGGTTAADRNIISGNSGDGVYIGGAGGTTSNTVKGNYIGIDRTGTADLGNGGYGVFINDTASGNTIGGTAAADRNIISKNVNYALVINNNSNNNIIKGNYIGTDFNGTADLGNNTHAIVISLSDGTQIGGTTADESNVISGNGGIGIVISNGSDNTTITGNYIGTANDGVTALQNDNHGIYITGNTTKIIGTVIGGTNPGEANVIAYNAGDGVYISEGDTTGTINNKVSGNSIFENTELGIDLDGVGANNDKLPPTLHSITPSGANFTVVATATAGDTIEFFRVNNGAAPATNEDPTGSGEGFLFLGSCVDNGACTGTHVGAADNNGTAGEVEVTLLSTGLSDGDIVSATATDGVNGTSEFSGNMIAFAASGTKNVYYSVGQNTSNHMTGSPTMTISGGTVTFSVPQTAVNMGVGDKVTYNGTSIAYISGKVSTTVWNLVTAAGYDAADATDATVDSITHAYASLFDAEAGASNATHLNTSNLLTGDYVLNIPCYYDSGPDVTAVTVDGWTTGANNYIKIYTPADTASEVNQTQRHDGQWNTGKYYIDVGAGSNLPLILSDEHIRVDGLQITTTYVNSGTSAQAIYLNNIGNNADIRISNNVLNGGNVGTAGDWNRFGIILQSVGSSSTVSVWNNIVYEWGGKGWGMYINDTDVTAYVYNNTFYDNPWYGIRVANGSVIAKNNLIFGSGNTNTYSGTFTAGTDYNSTDSTDNIGQGSNNRTSQTFTFVNTGTDDYHLASTDTGALNRGVDLSGDPNLTFSNDIDDDTRPYNTLWDVGADEETSLPTYSITGKVFEDKVITNGVGQPFNGGEGDAGIDGVRVELFRASDSLYLGFDTTAGGGNYSFSSLGGSTNYKVRVVASTVNGSGGALGEQSFESDGTTDYGTFTTAMGGQAAATADIVTLSTLTGAEHWVQVSVAAANVTGVDLGFSYDLVANSNDTGQGSLRQFITNAGDIAGANTSEFNIPDTDGGYQNGGAGASYWRIQPVSTYTISAGDISIDGSTQTTNATALGYFVNASGPEIEIDGSSAGVADGFYVTSSNNTIKGFIINSFTTAGYAGVRIDDGVAGAPGPTGNTISGNYIGTDYSGAAAAGTGNDRGIILNNGANGNTIGGEVAADRNIISGNIDTGVMIRGTDSDSNIVKGNYIGTKEDGLSVLANGGDGIRIDSGAKLNTVGGDGASKQNVISGNGFNGVFIVDLNTDNNTVSGNYIGTDKDGTGSIPNLTGIFLSIDSASTTVGGTNVGERNVISGNTQVGVVIRNSDNNTVYRNYIGTEPDGVTARGNLIYGVEIYNGSLNNTMGGTAAGQANTIAFNGNIGVYIHNTNTDNNKISGNSIFENTNLGIDLGTAGVGPGGDGANNDKAAPSIDSVAKSGSDFTVSVSVTSGDTVEFFRVNNAAAPAVSPDSSDSGEGYLYLGSCVDNGGNCSGPHIDTAVSDADASAGVVEVTLKASGLSSDDILTATATDATNGTSEFAINVTVDPAGLTIIKQVWEPNGTAPLGTPVTAPAGATLVYLIYVKNTTAGKVLDLRMNDNLDDSAFDYVEGSLIMDDGSLTDSSSDLDIFNATASVTGTPLSDAVDANVASGCDVSEALCPGSSMDKMTVGAVVGQANTALNINGNSTFAIRFEVKMK